jgi:hypothetical protein
VEVPDWDFPNFLCRVASHPVQLIACLGFLFREPSVDAQCGPLGCVHRDEQDVGVAWFNDETVTPGSAGSDPPFSSLLVDEVDFAFAYIVFPGVVGVWG